MLVRVNIPKLAFTQYIYQLEQNSNCRQFVNMAMLHSVCYSLLPLYINYRTKEQQYQNEIKQILVLDLPAIMPTFNKSRVNLQSTWKIQKVCNCERIHD